MTLYPQSRDARGSAEISLVLSSFGVNFKHFYENFRLAKSPCCGHDKRTNASFSISDDKGLWRCFHCKKVGNWVSFCDMIGHHLDKEDRYVNDYRENFKDEWAVIFKERQRTPVSSGKYPNLLEYCNNRGISSQTLDAFRVSSKGQFTLHFPIFSWHEDKWQRVSGRNVRVLGLDGYEGAKNWFEFRGGPTHLLLGNHLLDLTDEEKRIFIFEGQWDMLTAYELGLRNVFSLPNGASNVHVGPMLQYIPEDWMIYVCTDMDEAGHKAAESFFSQIGSERFRRLWLPEKDLNDWLMAKTDLTKEDVLKTAKGVNIPEEENENYLNFFDGEIQEEKPISDTPWPLLNEYIQGGFFEGQITSVLAPSGSGKTTIVNTLAFHIAMKKVKVGLISLEDTEKQLKSKLRRAAMGMGADKEIIGYLLTTRLNGQKTTHQQIIVQVDRFIREGCQIIIVDNVNYLTGTLGDERETFRNILNRIEGTNVHAIIVTQPNKIDGEKKIVSSSDMKGFSDTYQGIFNHLNLCKTENDLVRFIHVEKCRMKCPKSKANVYLQYDEKYNFYRQIDKELAADTKPRKLSILQSINH